MDISKELEQIDNNKIRVAPLLNNLVAQREELDKKIHLFKIVQIANTIKEMVNNDEFKTDDIYSIKLFNVYDDDYGYRINFRCYDKNYDLVSEINWLNEPVESINVLEKLIQTLIGFNSTYINEDFVEGSNKEIIMKQGCEKDFLNLLLSKELKTTLDYSTLKKEVPQANEVKPKKHKI